MNLKLDKCADRINNLQGFGKEVVSYLEYNAKKMKTLNLLEKEFEGYVKLNLNGANSKNNQKQSIYKEENLKAKLGIILMSESD
jgi:hypothetical protein